MEPLDPRAPVRIQKRVLAVDDEPAIVRYMKVALERQGYEVETAENGIQALVKIRANKPDLLITDVMMPEMDGFELSRAIRSDVNIADLPILIFGSRSEEYPPPHPGPWLRTGADRVFWKPFNPTHLAAFVDGMFAELHAKDI